MKQTILGAGGAIGIELAKALTEYTKDIRLVSRNPKKINETDEIFPADLLNPEEVRKAVEGSSIVYITVGFPYKLKVWKECWPPFMESVIQACIESDAKLVFFDNIYMYSKDHLNPMNEETPIDPPSNKGKIRTQVVQLIENAMKEGKLKALIARAADFYGPSIVGNSMLTEMVFKNLSAGKKANWMVSLDHRHSFTYTPDAGKATAILGNSEDAYNQVWHLPTAGDPMTGREWIEAIAGEMNVKPGIQTASRFIVRILGLFIPVMREMPEMLYQYDRDYVFDSSKFEKRFDFKPTPYREGIKQVVQRDYS